MIDPTVRLLEIFARLSLIGASSLDLQVVLDEIVRSAVELLNAAAAGFHVVDEAAQTLELRAVYAEDIVDEPPNRVVPFGHGLAGVAAARRQRLVVDDCADDDRAPHGEWFAARGLRAVICAPVTIDDTLVAVLAIARERPFTVDTATEQLLDALVAHAAIAFQHARLFDEADRRRRDAEVLGGLARAVNSSLDLDIVLQHVVDAAKAVCEADAARIALREPGLGTMRFRYSTTGWRLPLLGEPILPGRELGGRVLVSGRPCRTDDWLNDPDIERSSTFAEVVQAEGVKAALVVPIRIRGHIDGLLYAVRRTAAPFTDRAERRLVELADHAAIAIQNAQLHARTLSLSRRLVEAQEAERQSIARELHDQVGQDLTAVKLLLQRASRMKGRDQREALSDALSLVGELITRARGLSLDLRPPVLDDLGLVPALDVFLGQYQSRTGIAVKLEHDGTPRRVSAATETAVFRIVQEALTNVARHAGTSTARVRLCWRESVVVDIEDQGRGFDLSDADARLTAGLSGMRQRARWLGGDFSYSSTPREGTRIHADLPATPRHS